MPTDEQTTNNEAPTRAPLLYFFANTNRIPDAFRGRFGLESGFWGRLSALAGGEKCAHRDGSKGPDDQRGLLCTFFDAGHNPMEFLQYDESRQTWTEIEDGVWLGVDRDAMPEHFVREQIAMPKYVLRPDAAREDYTWFIPVALIDAEDCGLPRQDVYKKGQWHSVPKPGYGDIAERARYLYQYECGEVEAPSREWMRETAVLAISVNYALTAPEMAALDLLNTDVYDAIADMLTDKQARQKKTEPGSPDTNSGEPDDSTATDPHVST